MIIENTTQTVLRPSEGRILTNGTAYGEVVALGAGDSPDNWYEISIEEYSRIMSEQETETI